MVAKDVHEPTNEELYSQYLSEEDEYKKELIKEKFFRQ